MSPLARKQRLKKAMVQGHEKESLSIGRGEGGRRGQPSVFLPIAKAKTWFEALNKDRTKKQSSLFPRNNFVLNLFCYRKRS